jgi:hypothetical protein
MKLQNHSSCTKRETKSWVRVIEINHCMQNYNKVIITAWHWIKIYTEEYLYLSSVCQYQTPKILIVSSISFFYNYSFLDIHCHTQYYAISTVPCRAEHFRFGLVLDKKTTKPKLFFFKFLNRTEPKTDSNRTENRFEQTMFGSVRFFSFPNQFKPKIISGFFHCSYFFKDLIFVLFLIS